MNRLRELAERPVAPEVARAIISLALVVTVALGCLIALGVGGHGDPVVAGSDHANAPVGSVVPTPAPRTEVHTDTGRPDPIRPQDPQDRPGTAAHRRAGRELATHRALQHVPWRRGGVSIRLVGAHRGKAVLSVVGPSVEVARRGYRSFLRRFDDDDRSYLPRFTTGRAG